VLAALERRGASFAQDLQRASELLPEHFEAGLTQLIGHGLVTCDSFGGLRRLITPPSRRSSLNAAHALVPAGRWSRFRMPEESPSAPGRVAIENQTEQVARLLLARYGVIFRRMLERERIPLPWRALVQVYRRLELRGDVRGGRFVQFFTGEQYALPGAIEQLRTLRRQKALGPADDTTPLRVAAADPLNLGGILTPEARIPALTRQRVAIG
jgi:ATP-dependent Lhr-like helicase